MKIFVRIIELYKFEFAEVSMASSKEYLEFILEQVSELEEVTYRAMMGCCGQAFL